MTPRNSPAVASRPISSLISRTSASRPVSPNSMCPPGRYVDESPLPRQRSTLPLTTQTPRAMFSMPEISYSFMAHFL